MKKIAFAFMLITIALAGCNEENLTPIKDLSEPQFENLMDMYFKSSKYKYAKKEQLEELSHSLTFKSFGTRADEIYDELLTKISNGTISSSQGVENFVKIHSRYLSIIIDEEGEKTVELSFDQGYRYFMNENRVLPVGDKNFLVFQNGLLELSDDTRLDLGQVDLTYSDLKDPTFFPREVQIDGSTRIDANDPNDECGQQKSGQTTNGDERTKAYAITERQSSGNTYYIGAAFQAKAFNQTLGFWFSVERTLKGAWAIGLDYETNGGWTSGMGNGFYPPFKAKVIGEVVHEDAVVWNGADKPDYHLNGVFVWADTPSTTYADKLCNEDYICIVLYCEPPFG